VSYSFGDIVLVRFPYTDSSNDKIRPSLVLLDTGDDDIVLARVTSKKPYIAHDIRLQDWKAAHLPSASTIRLHKINTIVKTRIIDTLGQLSEADRTVVRQHLQKMWER
jgi:mRNA interferase MazF